MNFTQVLKAVICSFLIFLSGASVSFSQVTSMNTSPANVKIIADKQTGCAPEAITFSLPNAGSLQNITWVIGTDTIKNAGSQQTYLFSNAGTFNVSVTYMAASGNDTTISETAFITLGKGTNPVSLNASRTKLCNGPDTVNFNAFAKGAQAYDWIIDGTNYLNAGPQLVHQFKTAGKKTITIRIKDSSGCYGIQTFTDFIEIATAPVINFEANVKNGCLPLKVNFNSLITKGSADIATWKWEFTGSNKAGSLAQNPTEITYAEAGTYDVKLTVTTKDGCIFSITKSNYITVGDTITPKFISDNKNICPGDIITYTNVSPVVKIGKYVWSFPGGTVLPNSNIDTQYVRYEMHGIYNARLSYLNGNCNKSTTLKNAAVVEKLKADFTADNLCNCRVPDTINFINNTILPVKGTATYEWTFYDADGQNVLATSTDKNPSFVYKKYGRYNVKLVVKHSNGCSDSVTKLNLLNFEELQPKAINANSAVGCIGKDLTLSLSQLPNCGKYFYTYEWIIYKTGSSKEITRLYGAKPAVKLYETGLYDVKMIVSNGQGCAAEKKFSKLINIILPEPDFIADRTEICQDGKILLTEKTTPYNPKYTHSWKLVLTTNPAIQIIGDGNTFVPSFSTPGIYDVIYTVGFSEGCQFTVTKKNFIKISGVQADFSAPKQDGCLPFSTNLKSEILANKNFISNDDSVKYEWIATPSTGVTFSDKFSAQTQITINQTGYYSISLKVTNGDGCTFIKTKNKFFCAGVEAVFNMPAQTCLNEKLQLKNWSTRNTSVYEWSSNDSSVIFLPSAQYKSPEVVFTKSGKFTIKLKSASTEGCSDEFAKVIKVSHLKANFTSVDTINTCAPAYVSFSAYNTGADSFIWHFGDGETLYTKDTNIAHIYKNNSGDMTTGFDVTLIAISKNGCIDSISRKKYIKVLGPIPAFTVSNTIGCEPLLVNFTNQSKYTPKFYLDFGDFSQPDTSLFGPHIFTIKDPNAEFEVFKPRLLAKDEFGCSVWAYSSDSIIVYRKPVASFTVNNSQVCAQEAVQFTNTSSFAVKYKWDFNNDGTTDDTTQNPEVFLKQGTYNVKLTVENSFGCVDTFFISNAVTVFPRPTANITSSADTICAGNNVYFTISSTSETEIKSYKWFINNEVAEESGTARFTKAFSAPGIYAISAEVESENGCKNVIRLEKTVFVPDTAAPATPSITHITVRENAFIQINWNKVNDASFSKYKLYKKDGESYQLVYSSKNANQTQFIDRQTYVNTENYSYYLQVENFCGKSSLPSAAHKSILLKLYITGKNQLQLSWNKYKGWNSVRAYEIYRSEGNKFQKVTQVSGNDSVYTDKGLCDQDYTYYVKAVNENGNYTSVSNNASGHPVYFYNTLGEDIRFATVTDNNEVKLEWTTNQHEKPKAYIIDRLETGKGWVNEYARTTEPYFIDKNVTVNSKSYAYRISVEDACGKITNTGEIGKTIHLTATPREDKVALAWTQYGKWKNGVRQYRIELQITQNDWELVATASGNDTTFVDEQNHENIKGPYVYRIVAEENAVESETSTSNKAEVILPSTLYVPNAFTPNADGRNEEFKPVGRFIHENAGSDYHNYKLTIYNRWGEIVFESSYIDKGWDGTFRGTKVQQDTYIYTITAFGYDKQSYYIKGSFVLLR